ncbi:MAG: methyltransferase [Myxococcales bacterium]|nr:methyltransferase [Myxococcales bacterium]
MPLSSPPSGSKSSAPGLIRPARRPAGFVPGGPHPAGPQGRPELVPGPGEDLCYLAGDFRIFQRQDGHRWSLDDLVTAHVAAQRVPRPPTRHLDLGCGIGSVLMMLAWRFPQSHATGVEAQPLSAGLARRSLAYNGLSARVQLLEGDFREGLSEGVVAGGYELVTGTPPYFDPARGVQSEKPQCGPCRFEHRGGVEAYCDAAARYMTANGLFVMVAPTDQATRAIDAGKAAGLVPGHRLDVVPRAGKAPLVTVFAFARTSGAASTETLVVRDHESKWTPAFKEVRRAMGMPCAWS